MGGFYGSWFLDRNSWSFLIDRVVIGLFVVLVTVIVLVEFDVLPLWTRVLGIPAFAVTVLVDVTLHNHFFVDVESLWWGILAVFVYLQSLILGLLFRYIQSKT